GPSVRVGPKTGHCGIFHEHWRPVYCDGQAANGTCRPLRLFPALRAVGPTREDSMSYRNLIGCATVATTFCLALGGAQAQDLSKYPDWSGQWKSVVNPLLLVNPLKSFAFGLPWDPDKPSGPGQQAPLTPEYQARYEANLADQAAGGQGDERHSYC